MRAAILWVAALPLTAFSAEPVHRLTVQQALETALKESPALKTARARLEGAQAQADSTRGRLLPGIHLSDEQQHWNSPYNLAFPLPGLPPGASAPVFPVRALNTNTFVAATQEPLLGLLHIGADYSGLLKSRDAAGAELGAAEAEVREQVQSDFLRLFEARALAGIAKASEQQLAEQVQVAQSKLEVGTLTTADVLRLKVAVANARQQEIQAEAQEQVARASLLEAIGLSADDDTVDFEEPKELESEKPVVPELSPSLSQAFQNRPELLAARLSAASAKDHALAKKFSLLPEVNLEAGYSHVEGQVFAPKDSSFVGLKADWSIFEWGAQFYEARAADAQAWAAEAQAQDAQRRVGTEVSSRISQVRAAASALDVGQATVASAEEAYRVTQALSQAGSATTTDLLDAQAALTQARLNLVRAHYEFALARVAYLKATGGR